jgi:hypothetical protein
MKYKIHYKANDEVHNLEPITKFMESQGYEYASYDMYGNVLFIRPDIDDPSEKIYFIISLTNKTISKYVESTKLNIWNISFTSEELKFFDLLNFEIGPSHSNDMRQDITDWVDDV